MDWKRRFKPHILERGLDYYQNGFVEDYCKGKDFVVATVQGSDACDVHINIADEIILVMECSCPYAQDQNNCKHMAAVLFCMDDEADVSAEGREQESMTLAGENEPEAEKSIRKLVSELDETAARNLLIEILESDEKLQRRFKSSRYCDIPKGAMKRYKNLINQIFSKYAVRHGFIDYYSADSFFCEIEEFLDNDIVGMVSNRQYKEAFEILGYVFVKIGNQDMDDSDGGTGMLAERCVELWQEILKHCDKSLKISMFQWFKEQLDGHVIDYMAASIERLLFDGFHEKEFLEEKLSLASDKVSERKKEIDSWAQRFHAGEWAIRYIDVMKELKMPYDKIEAYEKENLEISDVRKYYVQDCIKRSKYDEAMQALEAGKEADKSFAGLVADYSLLLKDLYKKTGRMEEYIRELWLLILQIKAGSIAIYKELKTLYTEKEWLLKREIIFEKLSPSKGVDKLYQEEKLYDRLLKLVLDSNGLYMLTEYENCLQKLYPEELLTKYETAVSSMATNTADRKHYRELVKILKRMKKYPKGNQSVDQIVCSWKSKYKNRPAMMDELSKL